MAILAALTTLKKSPETLDIPLSRLGVNTTIFGQYVQVESIVFSETELAQVLAIPAKTTCVCVCSYWTGSRWHDVITMRHVLSQASGVRCTVLCWILVMFCDFLGLFLLRRILELSTVF
jgi:hypothetical protein